MATRFLTSMGADVAAVKRSVGADGGSESNKGKNETGVIYSPISRETMRRFRDFYEKDETDIANANGIKDFYTLNENVAFYFGGIELEEEKYAIRQALCSLMSKARSYYDMYGFVAIYNPDIRADRCAREINYQVTQDLTGRGSTVSQFASPLDTPELLLAEATRLIKNSLTTDQEKTKRQILGDDAGDESLPASKRSKKIGAYIEQNPRISSIRNPGAVMRERPLTTPRNDNDDGDSAAIETPDSAEIAYREALAREQRRNKRRTLDETIIGLRNLQVVDIDDGLFYVETDLSSMKRRVVFMRSNSVRGALNSNSGQSAAQISDVQDYLTNGQALMIDPDVFVYEWPNRTPFSDGTLNSKMYEVIRRRDALDQADRNAADVDLTNSHPVQILEHVPVVNKLDVDRMTDQLLYGGGATQTVTETREAIRRDAILDFTLKASAALQNKKRQGELVELIASGRVGRTSIDSNGNSTFPEFKKYGFFPLPSGFKLSTGMKPEITVDIEMLVYRFRRALSNAIGVPMVLLDGGSSFSGRVSKNSSGSSSAGASTATQAISDSRLRNTILADRIVLRQFIDSIWDIMYRQIDNDTLQMLLDEEAGSVREESELHLAEMRVIRDRLKTITDLAEATRARADLTSRRTEIEAAVARLRELSSRVTKITQMQHRFTVEFKSLAFIPMPELQMGQMAGALTKLDYANALRANFGLTPMTQKEFDANKESELDEGIEKLDAEAKVQAKYALKPKPGAIGGAKPGGKK
jgi:hypothetical protein